MLPAEPPDTGFKPGDRVMPVDGPAHYRGFVEANAWDGNPDRGYLRPIVYVNWDAGIRISRKWEPATLKHVDLVTRIGEIGLGIRPPGTT